jgi:hypothetical protein
VSNSTAFANNFATIAQDSVTSSGSLAARIASDNRQTAAKKKIQDAISALAAAQNMVQPTNTLDPVLYLGDGVTVDTASNIMTMTDGTKIDAVTGLQVA